MSKVRSGSGGRLAIDSNPHQKKSPILACARSHIYYNILQNLMPANFSRYMLYGIWYISLLLHYRPEMLGCRLQLFGFLERCYHVPSPSVQNTRKSAAEHQYNTHNTVIQTSKLGTSLCSLNCMAAMLLQISTANQETTVSYNNY